MDTEFHMLKSYNHFKPSGTSIGRLISISQKLKASCKATLFNDGSKGFFWRCLPIKKKGSSSVTIIGSNYLLEYEPFSASIIQNSLKSSTAGGDRLLMFGYYKECSAMLYVKSTKLFYKNAEVFKSSELVQKRGISAQFGKYLYFTTKHQTLYKLDLEMLNILGQSDTSSKDYEKCFSIINHKVQGMANSSDKQGRAYYYCIDHARSVNSFTIFRNKVCVGQKKGVGVTKSSLQFCKGVLTASQRLYEGGKVKTQTILFFKANLSLPTTRGSTFTHSVAEEVQGSTLFEVGSAKFLTVALGVEFVDLLAIGNSKLMLVSFVNHKKLLGGHNIYFGTINYVTSVAAKKDGKTKICVSLIYGQRIINLNFAAE